MQSFRTLIAATLAIAVTLVLCGAPQIAAAQQASNPSQPPAQSPPDDQDIPEIDTPASHQVPSPTGTEVDPSKGPLQPLPPPGPESQGQLPNAPSVQPAGTPQAPPVPMANAPAAQQQQPGEPVGTATAERTPTAGGAASKPAGTAIAPAKQRQVRSLVIKLGALGGAAVALGTVMALSRSTPSLPPGAKSSLGH